MTLKQTGLGKTLSIATWVTLYTLTAVAILGHSFRWIPSAWVETFYLRSIYPSILRLTNVLTRTTDISLTQPLLVLWVVVTVYFLIRRTRETKSPFRRAAAWIKVAATSASLLYLSFWLSWGILYLRPLVEDRLTLRGDEIGEIQTLATKLVRSINELYAPSRVGDVSDAEKDVSTRLSRLISTLEDRSFELPHSVKRPWPSKSLSAFGVTGVLSPWFHEPHVEQSLLREEAPFVVAHELSHAAGVSSEAEANFWAYLACRDSENALAKYSGCLALLRHVARDLDSEARSRILGELGEGPRDDLARIDERIVNDRWQFGAGIQRRAYDGFLKSQGIHSGVRDYGRVVELVLRFEAREG